LEGHVMVNSIQHLLFLDFSLQLSIEKFWAGTPVKIPVRFNADNWSSY
jgi:hypothetical protein